MSHTGRLQGERPILTETGARNLDVVDVLSIKDYVNSRLDRELTEAVSSAAVEPTSDDERGQKQLTVRISADRLAESTDAAALLKTLAGAVRARVEGESIAGTIVTTRINSDTGEGIISVIGMDHFHNRVSDAALHTAAESLNQPKSLARAG